MKHFLYAPCGCFVLLNARTTGSIKMVKAHAKEPRNECVCDELSDNRRRQKNIDSPIIKIMAEHSILFSISKQATNKTFYLRLFNYFYSYSEM